MSIIISKVETLNQLRFEPITAKVVKVVKMTRVNDRTTVVLGENGTIYTNGVQANIGYGGGHHGKLSDVIDGCVKLGLLSAAAAKEHKDWRAGQSERNEKRCAARNIKGYAVKLGLRLTAKQLEIVQIALDSESKVDTE